MDDFTNQGGLAVAVASPTATVIHRVIASSRASAS